MKHINRLVIIISVSLMLAGRLLAQENSSILPLTADSLASGNYKDAFKSFFQLAFDKFTSANKEIQFTSNPFAVMARLDTSLLVDTNYVRYNHLRNLNFSFGLKLDSSYRFNGFSSGIKYAIINRRDETVSRSFLHLVASKQKDFDTLNNRLNAYLSTIPLAQRKELRDQVNKIFTGELTLGQVDASLQTVIRGFTSDLNIGFDPKLNLRDISKHTYDSLKNLFQQGLLWTVGISDTTYSNQFLFSNILLNTELVKGFGRIKPGSNWEFDLKAAMNFVDDSLVAGRDLKRSIFSFEPGLNWIVRTKQTQKSFFEFNLSGSYYRNCGVIYPNEKRDSLTINGTLRIRILNDIWVPLEIKYDPRSGNVFGFINVRLNFTMLGRVARGYSK